MRRRYEESFFEVEKERDEGGGAEKEAGKRHHFKNAIGVIGESFVLRLHVRVHCICGWWRSGRGGQEG